VPGIVAYEPVSSDRRFSVVGQGPDWGAPFCGREDDDRESKVTSGSNRNPHLTFQSSKEGERAGQMIAHGTIKSMSQAASFPLSNHPSRLL
jgi:hypothetical protein